MPYLETIEQDYKRDPRYANAQALRGIAPQPTTKAQMIAALLGQVGAGVEERRLRGEYDQRQKSAQDALAEALLAGKMEGRDSTIEQMMRNQDLAPMAQDLALKSLFAEPRAKTKEIELYEYSRQNPEFAEFMKAQGVSPSNAPAALQVFQAYQGMTPEQRSLFQEANRAPVVRDFGGYYGAVNPVTQQVTELGQKTLAPGELPSVKGAQTQAVEQAKNLVESQAALPNVITKAEYAKKVIDDLISAPGRETMTGVSGLIDPRNYIPGTEAKDAQIRLKQIEGQAFLNAFEALKGGGQITEKEGIKATEAIGRLSRAQSDDEFKNALNELKQIVDVGYQNALKKAGRGADTVPPAQSAPQQPIVVDW